MSKCKIENDKLLSYPMNCRFRAGFWLPRHCFKGLRNIRGTYLLTVNCDRCSRCNPIKIFCSILMKYCTLKYVCVSYDIPLQLVKTSIILDKPKKRQLNKGLYHTYLYCLVPMKEANNVSPASAKRYLKKEERREPTHHQNCMFLASVMRINYYPLHKYYCTKDVDQMSDIYKYTIGRVNPGNTF